MNFTSVIIILRYKHKKKLITRIDSLNEEKKINIIYQLHLYDIPSSSLYILKTIVSYSELISGEIK